MAKLLPNGNIGALTSVLDEARQMSASVGVEIPPSDPEYEKWMHWLATDAEYQKANTILKRAHLAKGTRSATEVRALAVPKSARTKIGAKPLPKYKVLEELATATGLKKKEVGAVLDALTELAYAQVNAGFVVPGIGKLAVVQRKARMGRNPATGEPIKIPAKKVLKFRIAKQAKDLAVPSSSK